MANLTPVKSEPWEGYLGSLLKNIETMLEYANKTGVALPEDLRPKIEELLRRPEVGDAAIFAREP